MNTLGHTFTPLALSLLLAACSVSPVAPPAPAAAPAQYRESGPWQHAAISTAAVPDDWWTLFKDPVLDDLERQLLVGNENLKSLVAAVSSARAVLEASRSATSPKLSTGLSATRSGSTPASTSVAVQNPANDLSLSANASWEIDLWGRLSQAATGAQASLQASANDLAAARLSVQAILAQTYFSMRTAEAQQRLLDRSVLAYRRSLELTQARYDGGVAARTDVLQAQTLLKSAQAQVAESTAQRAQFEHAIAVLLGLAPSAVTIANTGTMVATLAPPPSLPATLLERRPDIAAAQSRVAAAYAQIGVTDAAFFPTLNLTAGAQLGQSALANLLNAPNSVWALGAALAEPIFDGGQRRLASAQARASAEQATAAYRLTVLTALQEVEDNLVLARQLQIEAEAQQEALQLAQRTLEVTQAQYRGGTVSYLNVVLAQTVAYNSESNLLNVRNRQLAAVNLLLKNIAGRWQSTDDDAPACQAGSNCSL